MQDWLIIQIQIAVIVILVLILRRGMRKLPSIYSYMLWIMVFIRLICPVTLESKMGIMPSNEQWGTLLQQVEIHEQQGLQNVGAEGYQDIQEGAEQGQQDIWNTESKTASAVERYKQKETQNSDMAEGIILTEENVQADNQQDFLKICLCIIWVAGAAVLLGYNITLILRLNKRLQSAIPQEGNVYISREMEAPFTIGLRKPKIYLPAFLGEQEREYILCHERVHISRKDYLIKGIASLLTIIYWYHPLVWVAFYFMEQDMEMSCDEKVMQQLGEGIKKQYSQSLLNFAVGRRTYMMMPLGFGENNVKQRISNVLSYKGKRTWVWMIGLIIILAAGGLLFTSRKPEPNATE